MAGDDDLDGTGNEQRGRVGDVHDGSGGCEIGHPSADYGREREQHRRRQHPRQRHHRRARGVGRGGSGDPLMDQALEAPADSGHDQL